MYFITKEKVDIMRRKTVDTILVLTDAIKNILLTFSKSRSLPSALVQRANIILLSSYGVLNRDIAVQVGLHYNHVATWRNRFLNALPSLRELKSADPDKLEKEIRLMLSDKKCPGTRLFLRRIRS